jgi:hypothetical protein
MLPNIDRFAFFCVVSAHFGAVSAATAACDGSTGITGEAANKATARIKRDMPRLPEFNQIISAECPGQ